MSHSNYAIIIVMLLLPAVAKSDMFTVTRLDDPAPDGCPVNDCSLREAVIVANASQNSDTIILGNGTYNLSIPPDSLNEAGTGDLDITSGGITIRGNGYWLTVIDAQYVDRIFDIDEASLTLESMQLVNGLVVNELGVVFVG